MIMDSDNVFEEDQAMPAAAEVDAAEKLNLGGANYLESGTIFFNALVTEDGEGGTSLKVIFYDSADNSAFADIITSDVVDLADLLEGKVLLSVALPPDCRQYVKASLTAVGTFTGGKVSTFLSKTPLKSM